MMRWRPADRARAKSEEDRSVRRADWRFLLPSSPPRRIVCFAEGRLLEAAAAVGTTSAPEGCEKGEADLAVIANANASTLHAAFRAIRPGGSCYGEWRALSSGGWTGIRRRLEGAGFTEIACYWPWPSPNRAAPRYWLPLDAEPALMHFFKTRSQARAGPQGLRQWMLGLLWRVAFRARLLRPICAVAQRPNGGPSDQGALGIIHSQWETFGLGSRPGALSWMLFAPGASTLNKLVGFVFADDEQDPRLVVKLARVRESRAALAREAANLRAVHARRGSRVTGVPSLLFLSHTEPMLLGESFVTGRPLSLLLNRARYGELARKVTRWLSELAETGDQITQSDWWPRLVERPLTELTHACGSFMNPAELTCLRSRLAALDDLPLVMEQRDCAPWNLSLTSEGRLVVHDWESAELRGLPLLDLIYFLAYSAFSLDGAMTSGRYAESYRASRDPTTLTGHVGAQCEADYLRRLGLEYAVVPPLRALTWLVHLHSDCVRVRDREPRESVFMELLREEMSIRTPLQ